MSKTILFFFSIFFSLNLLAQKNKKPAKPQVLVYGHEADAFAAAMQSAQSGVETLWIIDSTAIGGALVEGETKRITGSQCLDVGIWAFFLSKLSRAEKISDSISSVNKLMISPRIAQNTFDSIIDTISRLSIRKNLAITRIEQSGKMWQVTLNNREKIKVRAIVDATQYPNKALALSKKDKSSSDTLGHYEKRIDYTLPLYKTGIAVAQIGEEVFNVPLKHILPDSIAANYFSTRKSEEASKIANDINALPLRMLQGQACGAAAAYCAFFNTSSDKINTRTLQGELLAYKSFLLPFQDISLDDPHYPQIQRIGATGVLEGYYQRENKQTKFLFAADQTVSSSEIEPVIKQLYTRSQIWFKNNQMEALRLVDLLDLIKYVANKGDELQAEVEKGWKKRFKFKNAYELNAKLTRREFAVLLDTYLQPFNVRITFDGVSKY